MPAEPCPESLDRQHHWVGPAPELGSYRAHCRCCLTDAESPDEPDMPLPLATVVREGLEEQEVSSSVAVSGGTASPKSERQQTLDEAWRAVDALGAPETARLTDDDRAYCRAIGDALVEIEKLGGDGSTPILPPVAEPSAPLRAWFGDIIENGWASEENPTRVGFFVREGRRTGGMNRGRYWEVTDGHGKFWELAPTGDHKITVRAAPEPYASVRDRATGSTVPGPHTTAIARDFRLHHSTAVLINLFMVELALKLSKAEQKYGYSDGWLTQDWEHECRRQLWAHAAKGDPLDVAAYAAFCWRRGWPTTLPDADTTDPLSRSGRTQDPSPQSLKQEG